MNKTFFTADTHFGHERIIEYCRRPFVDSDDMDNTLIANWNSVIGKNDTVYHLGDFTLTPKFDEYITQLNGNIIILAYPEHHDRWWLAELERKGYIDFNYGGMGIHVINHVLSATGAQVALWPQVTTLRKKFSRDVYYFAMSHYPMAEWDRRHYGAFHLHGHSHGNYNAEGAILDVGVDSHLYKPILAEDVIDKIIVKERLESEGS